MLPLLSSQQMKVGTFGRIDVLAQVVLDDLRHVGVDRLVVGDAGARRVGQRHAAGAIDVHQAQARPAANRRGTSRVEKVVVDAAIDHVDALRALGRGPHEDVAVGDDQVAALHQLDPHLLGQEQCSK